MANVASALLIVGILFDERGPVTWLLSTPPMVLIGKVSYGLYLWHGAVFQVVTTERTGLDSMPNQALRLMITAVVVVFSYKCVELPFLRRKGRFERRTDLTAPAELVLEPDRVSRPGCNHVPRADPRGADLRHGGHCPLVELLDRGRRPGLAGVQAELRVRVDVEDPIGESEPLEDLLDPAEHAVRVEAEVGEDVVHRRDLADGVPVLGGEPAEVEELRESLHREELEVLRRSLHLQPVLPEQPGDRSTRVGRHDHQEPTGLQDPPDLVELLAGRPGVRSRRTW